MLFVFLVSSDYFKATRLAIYDVYYLVVTGETSGGSVDNRLSLSGKIGIIDAIKESPFFGTGYDPSWFTGDGGENEWEGADYIFLGSLAQFGVVGLILFLPFYIMAIKIIRNLLFVIRANFSYILKESSILRPAVLVGLAASVEFIRNIIEYPNWFFPIATTAYAPRLFIYFGLLLGSLMQINKYFPSVKSKL